MSFGISAKGGGSIDVRAIRRMARGDEIFIGHPSGVMLGKVETAQLAEWLHDGTGRIPARPYLLQGLRAHMSEIRKAMKLYLEEKAKNPNIVPIRVAVTAVGAVQEFVRSDYYKGMIPNAPSTIERKGSDTPLIDTGALVNSVTYQIGSMPEVKMPQLEQMKTSEGFAVEDETPKKIAISSEPKEGPTKKSSAAFTGYGRWQALK
jgi:hypothetical protein